MPALTCLHFLIRNFLRWTVFWVLLGSSGFNRSRWPNNNNNILARPFRRANVDPDPVLPMDIQTWLRKTEFSQRPVSRHNLDPRETGKTGTVRDFEGRRQRSPNSSTIEYKDRHSPQERNLTSRRHRRERRSHSLATTSSDSSPSLEFSSSHGPSEHFERRPRRKTRNDLYEPYSGARKRRSQRKQSRGKKRKKANVQKGNEKYHRTKRVNKAREKPGQTLLRGFHADNVSSERLTVGIPAQLLHETRADALVSS